MSGFRFSRRGFLQRATAVASVTAINARTASANAKSRYPMGLQLYTVRDPMAQDAAGTLKAVAALGYRDLETYGFDPGALKYYGMAAAEFRKVLDDLDLTTTSGHYDLHRYLNQSVESMTAYVDRCIQGALALNQKYITWAWLDPQSRDLDSFKLVAERLNLMGAQAAKAN